MFRIIIIAVLLSAVLIGCAHNLPCNFDFVPEATTDRIALGMDFDEAIAVIKKHGGEDSTSRKQVMTPPGVTPNRGGYWWLQSYSVQIAIGERDGRVSGLSYWDGRDLGVSKIHEGKTERRVTSLTFDPTSRRVSDERLADK
jgi:hypothetical protein